MRSSPALAVASDRRVLAESSRPKQLLSNPIGNAVAHGGDDVTVTVGAVPPMYAATRAETSRATAGRFRTDPNER